MIWNLRDAFKQSDMQRMLVQCLIHNKQLIDGSSFCCSVAKSCLTLYEPMDYSMAGYPVLHYLLEFAQTHAH